MLTSTSQRRGKRTLMGAAVLAAGLTLAPIASASAAPIDSPASSARVSTTQATVNDLLKDYPGSRQVGSNKIAADGFDMVVQPSGAQKGVPPTCGYGYLCAYVGGVAYYFYDCKLTLVNNWYGASYFINNQTPGTLAKFFNANYWTQFSSTAFEQGTFDATPIGSVRPC